MRFAIVTIIASLGIAALPMLAVTAAADTSEPSPNVSKPQVENPALFLEELFHKIKGSTSLAAVIDYVAWDFQMEELDLGTKHKYKIKTPEQAYDYYQDQLEDPRVAYIDQITRDSLKGLTDSELRERKETIQKRKQIIRREKGVTETLLNQTSFKISESMVVKVDRPAKQIKGPKQDEADGRLVEFEKSREGRKGKPNEKIESKGRALTYSQGDRVIVPVFVESPSDSFVLKFKLRLLDGKWYLDPEEFMPLRRLYKASNAN